MGLSKGSLKRVLSKGALKGSVRKVISTLIGVISI